MYGLVNRALRDLITSRYGSDMWDAVRAKAGIVEDVFIGSEAYDDRITYQLVGAASEVTGMSPTELLRAFGEHWVVKTAQESYGGLMDTSGRTIGEFLSNLPEFHARVSLIFPKLQPPRFEVTQIADRTVELHYRTHRAGLSEFVIGILNGLGKKFGTPVHIEHTHRKSDGDGHDIFLIRWEQEDTDRDLPA